MRYLLDTHVFLWWLENDKRLKSKTRELIADSNNAILVSVVSAWEIATKLSLGKISLETSLNKLFEDSDFKIINVELNHVLELHELPLHHRDPFDRMIIAQALIEKCILVTVDKKLHQYQVPILK